jgi:hypothetical protein
MRHENWPSRLSDFIGAASGRPFSWGSSDCCLFAADWVQEATGIDPAAEYRGRYRTEAGAARLLNRLGGSVEAAVDKALGMPLTSPLLAQRGDIALVDGALGIVIGGEVALMSEAGLVLHPLAMAARAWRIE